MKTFTSAAKVLGFVLRLPLTLVVAVFLVIKHTSKKDISRGQLGPMSKIATKDNISVIVRGENGAVKKYFQHNGLGRLLMRLNIDLRNMLTGSMKGELNFSNLITNAGLAELSSLINGTTSPASFDFLGIGTGTTAANATDTALVTEINQDGNPTFSTRGAAGAASRTTTTVTNDTATIIRTFTIGAFTPAITEVGLFNAATSGSLFARKVFTAVNLVENDNLQVTYNISSASA